MRLLAALPLHGARSLRSATHDASLTLFASEQATEILVRAGHIVAILEAAAVYQYQRSGNPLIALTDSGRMLRQDGQ
jgi:hypothetical protein